MAGGQVIGSVSIKVRPDTTDFKRRLKAALERIERQVQFAGQVSLEVDKESMHRVEKELKDWVDRISPLKIQVKPDLKAGSTIWINKRLQYVTRPRLVPIIPYLNKIATNKVSRGIGTLVAALSGGRILGDFLENLWDGFKNLDKIAPKIGAIGTGIMGLASTLLVSVSNITALIASLASVAAVALTLPGALVGMGIGLGIVITAMLDFKKVLPGVVQQFTEFRSLISGNFWAKAAGPIKAMFDELNPILSKGLGTVSTAMGDLFGTLATALTGSLDGSMGQMFADLAKSLLIAKDGAVPLAEAIRVLGEVGASYLPQFAQWLNDIIGQFADWLSAAQQSGELTSWIASGLANLKAFFSAMRDLGGIILAVGDAAAAAGGSPMTTFAATMESIRKVVESPGFQQALTGVFSGAHEALSLIADIAGTSVVKFFETLGSTLEYLLPIAGGALGVAIKGLADGFIALMQTDGLVDFFRGISAALRALAPVMGPLGTLMGTLGTSLGNLLNAVAPLLTAALLPLISVFQTLLPVIDPIVNALSGVLLSAVQALGPVLEGLAPLLAVALVDAFTALGPVLDSVASILPQLLPMFFDLLVAVMPLIPPLAEMAATTLPPLIEGLLQLAMGVLPPLIDAINTLMPYFLLFLQAQQMVAGFIMAVLLPALTFLGQYLGGMITSAVQVVMTVFGGLKTFLQGVFNFLNDLFHGRWGELWEDVKQILRGAIEVVKGLFTGLVSQATNFMNTLANMIGGKFKEAWDTAKSRVSTGISNAVSLIKGLPGKAVSALGNIRTTLLNAGHNLIQGFIDGIGEMFKPVSDTLGRLTDLLPDWKGPVAKDRTLLTNAGQLVMDGFIRGLESRYGLVRQSLASLTKDVQRWDFGTPTSNAFAGLGSQIDGALSAGPGVAGRDVNLRIDATGTQSTPDDIADAVLFGLKRVSTGGRYAFGT